MLLTKNIGNNNGYNMLISGFVLGTVVFALFLWSAIQSFKSIKQIKKFKDKTENYYEDKYATVVIYLIETLILFFYVAELAIWIAAMVTMSEYHTWWDGHHDADNKLTKPTNLTSIASGLSITADVLFLVVVVLVISYMAVAQLWMPSLIVVVDQDTLITSNAIAPRSVVTVSRVLKSPHVFKITYKDQEIKGNLKDTKLRYSKGIKEFLIKNAFYAGDNND